MSDEDGRPSDWIRKQVDAASAEVASWPAWKRNEPAPTAKDRIVALERELASIAEVLDPHWRGAGRPLEADWMIREIVGIVNDYDACKDRLEAAESLAAAARRDAFEEAAKVAENEVLRLASLVDEADAKRHGAAAMANEFRRLAAFNALFSEENNDVGH